MAAVELMGRFNRFNVQVVMGIHNAAVSTGETRYTHAGDTPEKNRLTSVTTTLVSKNSGKSCKACPETEYQSSRRCKAIAPYDKME